MLSSVFRWSGWTTAEFHRLIVEGQADYEREHFICQSFCDVFTLSGHTVVTVNCIALNQNVMCAFITSGKLDAVWDAEYQVCVYLSGVLRQPKKQSHPKQTNTHRFTTDLSDIMQKNNHEEK